jgi:8-oxo-dGTP diphosphatase
VTVFTWRQAPVPDGLPVRQVHGWVADTTGRVLIQDRSHEARYLLPGGGCDPGDQNWTATLIRECAEESQVTIIPATVIYLGHQVVTGDPGVSGTYLQVRLFAVIGAFEPVAPDPGTGHEYRRLMRSIPAASRLLNWGLAGELQARAAAQAARKFGLPVDQPVPDSYA